MINLSNTYTVLLDELNTANDKLIMFRCYVIDMATKLMLNHPTECVGLDISISKTTKIIKCVINDDTGLRLTVIAGKYEAKYKVNKMSTEALIKFITQFNSKK